jgi:hypothetical protein
MLSGYALFSTCPFTIFRKDAIHDGTDCGDRNAKDTGLRNLPLHGFDQTRSGASPRKDLRSWRAWGERIPGSTAGSPGSSKAAGANRGSVEPKEL